MSSALDIPGVPGEEVSPIEEVEKEEQKWGEEQEEPVHTCILVNVIERNSFYWHGSGKKNLNFGYFKRALKFLIFCELYCTSCIMVGNQNALIATLLPKTSQFN